MKLVTVALTPADYLTLCHARDTLQAWADSAMTPTAHTARKEHVEAIDQLMRRFEDGGDQ